MHRHTAGPRASTKFLHRPARSLRRTISLLSMFPAVAGVQPETSRSIKPRERDLGDLRLFFLVRILTRPTNHPRHAACASNYESKPVRPVEPQQDISGRASLAEFLPQLPRFCLLSQDSHEVHTSGCALLLVTNNSLSQDKDATNLNQ